MTRTICIYHANCADGFTAAWAVRQALGNDVEFIPAGYGDEPPDITGADVAEIAAAYGGGGHRNAAGFLAAAGWEGDKA